MRAVGIHRVEKRKGLRVFIRNESKVKEKKKKKKKKR
jgi:hypothetical protein